MGILIDLFRDAGRGYRSHYFLAIGELRRNLQLAEEAHHAQQEIMQEVKERFQAQHIAIAKTVDNGAAGFNLYFPQNDQPKNWLIPQESKEQLHFYLNFLYTPPEGSPDQKYLQKAQKRMLAAMQKSFPNAGEGHDKQNLITRSGWNHWSKIASENCGVQDVYAEPLGNGQFVVVLCSTVKNFETPAALAQSIKLSKGDAEILKKEPARIARIMCGGKARSVYERVMDFLP